MNGSGISGVTGLSTREVISSRLGDKISGVTGRGELEENWGLLTNPGARGLSLKFFRLFLRSYSREADFSFLGPVLMGGMAWFFTGADPGSGREDPDANLAVSEDPVSIWTTCLKEEVSAWTKVVGYGLFGSDLVMGTGT